MGHQSDDARKALHAYARDLQSTAHRGGSTAFNGTSKQDDASVQFSGSGAPHQLAMAAAVVCVVLLGGIGLAGLTGSSPAAENQQAVPLSTQTASVATVFTRTGSASTNQAIHAFNDLGMTRAVNALRVAVASSTESTARVSEAVSSLILLVREKLAATGTVSESEQDVAFAVSTLERAVRPPGLDPDRLPPGLGGTPPGRDSLWLPPGQDPNFVPPGQNPTFVPPGQDEDLNPNKGPGNNSGKGRP